VASILLLLPNPNRYHLEFVNDTQEDWAAGSASALWDIRSGAVLWADGLHTRESMLAQGKPLDDFIPAIDQ
jgi:hypothetical protein